MDRTATHEAAVAAGLPAPWAEAIGRLDGPVPDAAWWDEVQRFVDGERAAYEVFPAPGDVFAALRLTPPEEVKVVVLGQDPYFNGEAHGLSFSVRAGTKVPPSLRTILAELAEDVPPAPGTALPPAGDLTGWAEQGVLLLNASLTVRAGDPGSHQEVWRPLTDAVVRAVAAGDAPSVFVLWGGEAQKAARFVDGDRHTVLTAAHPAAYASAKNPLRGSRPFSRANAALVAAGREPVDWWRI